MADRCSRILVVEDDRALLELLEDYFAHENVEIATATNGRKALEFLTSGEPLPDVVLLDLRLPKMSGDELLARMRADPRLARIPVALMSGDASRVSLQHATGLPLLSKPFTIDELNAVLAERCSAAGTPAPSVEAP